MSWTSWRLKSSATVLFKNSLKLLKGRHHWSAWLNRRWMPSPRSNNAEHFGSVVWVPCRLKITGNSSVFQQFNHTSPKTSKIHITCVLWGEPPMTAGFPSQRAGNAKKIPCHDIIRNSFPCHDMSGSVHSYNMVAALRWLMSKPTRTDVSATET